MSQKVKRGGAWRDASAIYVKKGGVWKPATGAFIKSGGGYKSVTSRYMFAANGFTLATDWGVPDATFSATNLGMTGRAGGNGTAVAKWVRRRLKFTTGTWAPKAGRFLWTNAAGGINGVLDGLFNIFIQRCELRDTSLNLIATVKWGGSATKTLVAGEKVWSDSVPDLAANTTYYLDVWYYGDPSGAWPSGYKSAFQFTGEGCGASLSTDLSLSAMPTFSAGTVGPTGGVFGPTAFAAQGWDGTPVVMITGTSIEDGTAPSAQLATARGDLGFAKEAFGSSTGGIWNWFSASRYSQSLPALYTANLGGFGGVGVLDYMASCMSLLQSQPMFNVWYNEHGRNDVGSSNTVPVVQGRYQTAVAKARSLFSGIKILQSTIIPNTTATNNSVFTDETNQTPTTGNEAGGVLQQINDWIMAGGGGIFDFTADIAAPLRSANNYGYWKTGTYSGTLLDPVAATTTDTVRLDVAPTVGISLAFDPGNASADAAQGSKIYTVISVTANATSGWDVKLNGGRATVFNATTSTGASRVNKAHSAGAVVKSILTYDGTHPGHDTQRVYMMPPLAAVKSAIAASLV